MVCGAFLAVEFMRQGLDPQTALMKTMERVIAHSEKRLLAPNGRPLFGLTFYALAKDGRYAGAAAYSGHDVRRLRREGAAARGVRIPVPRLRGSEPEK